jgi:hypothetical protein
VVTFNPVPGLQV